jgi:hypothetical protein
MKFGNSYYYHDNWMLAFVMHQFVEFAMIMIENTAYFCGELILSQIGEPVLTSFFNDYQMIFRQMPSPLLGQEASKGDFAFNWRLTSDPVIKEGQMDLRMIGDIMYHYGGGPCSLEPDYFDFMEHSITS